MDKEKYNELVKCIELNRIILCKLNCEINVDILEEKFERAKVNFNPEFNLKKKEKNRLYAEAIFDVNVIEEKNQKMVFNINVSFLLIYNYKEECEDSVLNEFVKRNVPLNAWPYGREIISSITARMGLPPLNIGLYKVY
ncbi:protein-export chaperone SecB [Thermoanaerobacterium sp. DL9XJH110]|uniref:protein-export chaperone SecB n=1 Tax=Thermoanaerobacterium sp. DL9XJH110 TaxID=3386643 RepID=UPI003BB7815E